MPFAFSVLQQCATRRSLHWLCYSWNYIGPIMATAAADRRWRVLVVVLFCSSSSCCFGPSHRPAPCVSSSVCVCVPCTGQIIHSSMALLCHLLFSSLFPPFSIFCSFSLPFFLVSFGSDCCLSLLRRVCVHSDKQRLRDGRTFEATAAEAAEALLSLPSLFWSGCSCCLRLLSSYFYSLSPSISCYCQNRQMTPSTAAASHSISLIR